MRSAVGRVLGLVLVAVLLSSAVGLAATEMFVNKTGKNVTGIKIEFSKSVMITRHDNAFPDQDPRGRSDTFTFSGGNLSNLGRFSISWMPSSAKVTDYEWIEEGQKTQSIAAKKPMGLSKEARDFVYGYLAKPRECKGDHPFKIPVYVSVPSDTSTSDIFSIELGDGSITDLVRVDEVDLVGSIEVPSIPTSIMITIFKNSQPLGDPDPIEIENGYQAITIGLPTSKGGANTSLLGDDFLRGAAPTDIWGPYIYGVPEEWYSVHLRDYFDPTCDRLEEDGFKDVYATSFMKYVQITPLPKMTMQDSVGAGEIMESDVAALVKTAHAHHLRFHLMYNAFSETLDTSYLWRANKTEAWIRALFEEYTPLIVAQAKMAERCGVDALMLNWQDGAVTYRGHEHLWGDLWKETIQQVRAVFSGKLEYNVPMSSDLNDIAEGRVSVTSFAGIDDFLFSQWNPDFSSYNDSLGKLISNFSAWMRQLRAFKARVNRPVYLEVAFQSTDGYLVDGWHDVAVGKLGNTTPDFFEQARLYEALFQVINQTRVVDGIISYKYHWDDPFGPDMGMNALARMDLSASIRNKPAEAVVKKWFGGRPGPATMISQDMSEKMNRPWCRSCGYSVSVAKADEDCTFLIDDFESPTLQSQLDGRYDYDCSEMHDPGSDPTTTCSIQRAVSGQNGYLRVDYEHDSWLKARLSSFPAYDATAYSGISLTLSTDKRSSIQVELGTVSANGEWHGYALAGIMSGTEPVRYELPFSDFVSQDSGHTGIANGDLLHLVEIAVFVPRGKGTIAIDNLCFYNNDR